VLFEQSARVIERKLFEKTRTRVQHVDLIRLDHARF
jgi:hypothetical protein